MKYVINFFSILAALAVLCPLQQSYAVDPYPQDPHHSLPPAPQPDGGLPSSPIDPESPLGQAIQACEAIGNLTGNDSYEECLLNLLRRISIPTVDPISKPYENT